MVQPLILQYYQLLPEHRFEEEPADWPRQFRKALAKFNRSVEARYYESTLERLALFAPSRCPPGRGPGAGLARLDPVNAAVAQRLHDEDPTVRQLAADALWSIWYRADAPENNQELQRLMQLVAAERQARKKCWHGFDALIRKSPRFAEAYNQRAIFHFQRGDYARAIADCEKTLRLNPYHFGAASGMGQCFMKQKKLRAALRIYPPRQPHQSEPRWRARRDSIARTDARRGRQAWGAFVWSAPEASATVCLTVADASSRKRKRPGRKRTFACGPGSLLISLSGH